MTLLHRSLDKPNSSRKWSGYWLGLGEIEDTGVVMLVAMSYYRPIDPIGPLFKLDGPAARLVSCAPSQCPSFSPLLVVATEVGKSPSGVRQRRKTMDCSWVAAARVEELWVSYDWAASAGIRARLAGESKG
ncbi:hypothetical protein Droror1_Dr00017987 [Drosera rotundifolia]